MKICFLINDISNIGGVERVVLRLANKLSENNNLKLIIVSMFKMKNEFKKIELNENIELLYLNYEELWSGIFKDIKYQKKIFKESINKLDIDILITLYTTSNLVAAIMKSKLNFKVIACQHGQYYFDGKKINLLKNILYKRLSKVILLTERDKKIYDKFCKSTEVIINPVPFERKYMFDKSSTKILYIGRLSEEKSLNHLIESFNLIKDERTDLVLEIVGDGPERAKLIKLINKYNLEKRVILSSFTNNVVEKYSTAAFTVLTSQSEALPMMLIESKALGIPSISFDIRTGPREIIKNFEDGFLVEKNNDLELSKKMIELINNDKIREEFSKKAFENSIIYEIEEIEKKWMELFAKILN